MGVASSAGASNNANNQSSSRITRRDESNGDPSRRSRSLDAGASAMVPMTFLYSGQAPRPGSKVKCELFPIGSNLDSVFIFRGRRIMLVGFRKILETVEGVIIKHLGVKSRT